MREAPKTCFFLCKQSAFPMKVYTAIWETCTSTIPETWVDATHAPISNVQGSAPNLVTIRAGHTVTFIFNTDNTFYSNMVVNGELDLQATTTIHTFTFHGKGANPYATINGKFDAVNGNPVNMIFNPNTTVTVNGEVQLKPITP